MTKRLLHGSNRWRARACRRGRSGLYRQQTRLFHRGEEFKTERLIVIVSFSVFFALICIGSIVDIATTEPRPSRHDVEALPRW